jgi:hypothetical protein
MKNKMKPSKTGKDGMPKYQKNLTEYLSKDLVPRKSVSIKTQWLGWLVPTAVVTALLLSFLKMRSDLSEMLQSFPFIILLSLLLIGSLLAAWGALETSVPGGEKKGRLKIFIAIGFWMMAFATIAFFTPCQTDNYMDHSTRYPCFLIVLATGLLTWLPLAFFIMFNAPLDPQKTGLWSGIAVFLVGTGIISLHCESHNLVHIFVEHFLAVFIYAYLVSQFSYYFFSAWKKRAHEKSEAFQKLHPS